VDSAEVIGQVDEDFGAAGETEPQPGIRSVNDIRASLSRPVDAVFTLEAASRDDDT
jgi:hypothetical protein